MGQKSSRRIHEEKVKPKKIKVHPLTNNPTQAWTQLEKKLCVTKLPRQRFDSPQPANTLRFVCISDTHSRVENSPFKQTLPEGDVLLHAGDFTKDGKLNEFLKFDKFLGELSYPIKIVIPGNHELLLDPKCNGKRINPSSSETIIKHPDKNETVYAKRVLSNGILLIDAMVEICGIKIYGTPWVPKYGMPAFARERGKKLLKKYNQIPQDIDILLSHGPPLGFGDTVGGTNHAGCVELLNSIRHRIRPKYIVFGHIHGRNGIESDGPTTFINAAIANSKYKPESLPIIFDYPLPSPYTRADFPD